MDINFAKWYAKFRGSSVFLFGLLGYIVTWLVLHKLLSWWDKDLALINLTLSAEASISLAFFAMMQEQTDLHHAELMTAIKDMLVAQQKTDAEILETVEEIHEEVSDGH
jgi:uncharacterized membrane protein